MIVCRKRVQPREEGGARMEGTCCVYHGVQLAECLLVAPCVRLYPCFSDQFVWLPDCVSMGPLVIVHVIPRGHVFVAAEAIEAVVTKLDVYIHTRPVVLLLVGHVSRGCYG